MKATTTSARHVVMRLRRGDTLPDALAKELRDEIVMCGWLRASGVLSDVELRALDGRGRTFAGPLLVVSLEGSVGLDAGDVSCGMLAVLARETDNGIETIAGEIQRARIEALEVLVTAFDDVAATRRADQGTGLALVDELSSTGSTAVLVDKPRSSDVAPSPPLLVPEPRASDVTLRVASHQPMLTAPPLPPKPMKPQAPDLDDEEFPAEGDFVEHFHFGRCEVIKCDGDRLHLRLGKDGRIKEIALEMLRVTPLPSSEGEPRVFKLDRKL